MLLVAAPVEKFNEYLKSLPLFLSLKQSLHLSIFMSSIRTLYLVCFWAMPGHEYIKFVTRRPFNLYVLSKSLRFYKLTAVDSPNEAQASNRLLSNNKVIIIKDQCCRLTGERCDRVMTRTLLNYLIAKEDFFPLKYELMADRLGVKSYKETFKFYLGILTN